jgi:hypothetical protein
MFFVLDALKKILGLKLRAIRLANYVVINIREINLS